MGYGYHASAFIEGGFYSTSFHLGGSWDNLLSRAGASCLFIQFAKRVLRLGMLGGKEGDSNDKTSNINCFYCYDVHLETEFIQYQF
jgi:hypothetical protein